MSEYLLLLLRKGPQVHYEAAGGRDADGTGPSAAATRKGSITTSAADELLSATWFYFADLPSHGEISFFLMCGVSKHVLHRFFLSEGSSDECR